MAENHDVRSRRQAVVLSKEALDENALSAVIDATGYTTGDTQTKICEKKELFLFLKE